MGKRWARSPAEFKPLSHRERGWGEGAGEAWRVRCARLRPYPHPALRATFSRWEKGSGSCPGFLQQLAAGLALVGLALARSAHEADEQRVAVARGGQELRMGLAGQELRMGGARQLDHLYQ